MSWVFDYSQTSHGARLVLLSIANHADKFGTDAWPKLETMAVEAHLSVREVSYAIKTLVDCGELEVAKNEGRVGRNKYTLTKMLPAKVAGVQLFLPANSRTSTCKMEHRNKEEPSLTVHNTLSAPSEPTLEFSLNAETKSPSKKGHDPRHRVFMEQIQKAHVHFVKDLAGNPVTPVLGSSAGSNLKRLLSSQKSLDVDRFRRWLTNYHQSENHNPYDSPAQYILKLPNYEGGPVNKFGRVDG